MRNLQRLNNEVVDARKERQQQDHHQQSPHVCTLQSQHTTWTWWSLKLKADLIHDLLFLPISTIQSAVGHSLITHCCVSRLSCSRLSGHIEPHSPDFKREINTTTTVMKWIKLVTPQSTMKYARYSRVFHSRLWCYYNFNHRFPFADISATIRCNTSMESSRWLQYTDVVRYEIDVCIYMF